MNDKSINPVAIITGGSRGVGAATARLLASKGWNVTITCTSSIEDADSVVKECEALGVEALALSADVSDDASCKKTAEDTIQKWGRIDALVNNAGTTKFVFNHGDLEGLDAEDFLHIYKIKVTDLEFGKREDAIPFCRIWGKIDDTNIESYLLAQECIPVSKNS